MPQKLGVPRFPLMVVVPMTSERSQSWAIDSPNLYPKLAAGEAGLPRNSIILLDQVRAIDLNRLVRYLGSLSREQYRQISNSILLMIHKD
jgi:mRNA interferase MazF